MDSYAEYFPLAYRFEDAAINMYGLTPTAEHHAQDPAVEEAEQKETNAFLTLFHAANRILLLERDRKRVEALGQHFKALQDWAEIADPLSEQKGAHLSSAREAERELRDLVVKQIGSGFPLLPGKAPGTREDAASHCSTDSGIGSSPP